jgi:hypothetical protein
MVALYIFAGVIIAGTAALMVYRSRWGKAEKVELRIRQARLEKERAEDVAKAEARERS